VDRDRLPRRDEADIAFRDDLGKWQAIAAIAHRDLGHEPQMRGDEPMRRLRILMFMPALGKHVLLLRLQHRETPDLIEITGKFTFARNY
jgi:hypothetical protein